MTACVNNKKYGRRVAGVVTASLVGALTLGGVSLAAVPTVALAEQGADLQFSKDDLLAAGDVTFTMTRADGTLEAEGPVQNDYLLFTAKKDLTAYTVGIKDFKLPSGEPQTVDKNYYVEVRKLNADGTAGELMPNNAVSNPGDYVVVLKGLSGTSHEGEPAYYAKFVVAPQQLGSLAASVDNGSTFNGGTLKVTYNNGSDSLVEGKDYTVDHYEYVTTKGQRQASASEVKGAGSYTAYIKGAGAYAGTTGIAKFTVKPFEVQDANVTDKFAGSIAQTVVDVPAYVLGSELPSAPLAVTNYDASGNELNKLDPSLVSLEAVTVPTTVGSRAAEYRVRFDKDSVDAGNITTKNPGAGSLLTDGSLGGVLGDVADYSADFTYAGSTLQDSYELDSTTSAFNTSLVKAKSGKLTFTASDGVSVSFVKGSATDFAKGEAGTYTLVAKLFTTKDGKVYTGSKTFTVTYKAGSVDADSQLYVYATTDLSKAITSYAKAYDGKSLTTSDFKVVGKDADGQDISSDLKVKLVDKDGKDVNEAKAAGDYKLVVSSDKYALKGTTELPITVAKVDLTSASIDALEKWNSVAGDTYLPLSWDYNDAFGTGSKVSEYPTNTAANAIKSLKIDWAAPEGVSKALPSNVGVAVEYQDGSDWKQVGSINDFEKDAKGNYAKSNKGFGEGHYRVVLTVSSDDAANYVLPEGKTSVTLEFDAYNRTKFSDVMPSDWFYKPVNQAASNKYMNGCANTTTFGPHDAITRAQVASVLFNMSGASIPDDESNASHDVRWGWKTGFSDVDGEDGYSDAYYAKALYWAKKTGVVNGYGDGTFRPDQTVTREEFASMLANYAKVVNRDTTVDSADQSALSKFDDASGVSDWARGTVAWAVQNKVIGNGGFLNAGGNVIRAEAAAMAVNYQPSKK